MNGVSYFVIAIALNASFHRCGRSCQVLFYLVAATTTKDFQQRSFIEWNLKEKFYQEATRLPYRTDLRMMFRTRQRAGFLFMAQNQQKSKHLILEVRNLRCCFRRSPSAYIYACLCICWRKPLRAILLPTSPVRAPGL